jgi:hypothetical protein
VHALLFALGVTAVVAFAVTRSRSVFLAVERDPGVRSVAEQLALPYPSVAALAVLLGGPTSEAELRARAAALLPDQAVNPRLGVAIASGHHELVADALARTGSPDAAEALLMATPAGDAWRAHAELAQRFAGRQP